MSSGNSEARSQYESIRTQYESTRTQYESTRSRYDMELFNVAQNQPINRVKHTSFHDFPTFPAFPTFPNNSSIPSRTSRVSRTTRLFRTENCQLPIALKKQSVPPGVGQHTCKDKKPKGELLLFLGEFCLDGIKFGANLLLVSGNLCLELVELVADALHNLAV